MATRRARRMAQTDPPFGTDPNRTTDPFGEVAPINVMNCPTETDFPRAMLGTVPDFALVDGVTVFAAGAGAGIEEKFTARSRVKVDSDFRAPLAVTDGLRVT